MSTHRLLALMTALLVTATGCSDDRPLDASQAGKGLPDCSASECADEIAPIADGVAVLPGVIDVDLSYREKQITAGASVTGRVDVRRDTDCEDIEEDLGRLLWQSQVHPVTSITLRCYAPGSEETGYDFADYAFVLKEAATLEEAWGPRGG
ncbi:hypothetical protein [Nocardioides sp.]|uniref:hypothetical protein n=1 Tax=Nocardioides sp. TaxID=35761 RepID=UPI002B26AF14|nr:hypothetical protein [Nocardioides sp.]